MTDLNRSQAEWTRLLGEELAGLALAPIRELRELEDKFTRERTQVLNLADPGGEDAPRLAAITLAGIKYGVNCTPDGKLYVRFVANSSNWDVTFYLDEGGDSGDAVAWAEDVAAEGTAALVELNDSGVSGSITLGATIAGDTTDLHVLRVVVDYPARLPRVLTQDGTVDDDAFSRRDFQAAYARVADLMRQARAVLRLAVQRWALSTEGNLQSRGNSFTRTSHTLLGQDLVDEDRDGNVTRSRVGWFYELAQAMADETTGGEQDVARRVVSAAAGAFDAGNDGKGTVASHTPGEQALAGEFLFECSDATIGSERFRYSFASTDGKARESGEAGPVVGKPWAGPFGFGPITVLRAPTKTNDASNHKFAATTGLSVVGLSRANSADGDLYPSITANGGNWDVSFYRSASRHSSTLVARAVNVAGGAAFVAEPQGASQLTVNWALGSNVSAAADVVVSMHPFRAANAIGRPDRFKVAVTVADGPGLIQDLLAREFGVAINSDAAGSESIPDGYAMAGTFPPFVVQDN